MNRHGQVLTSCRYDQMTNTGGSNGATMRFAPEGDHGANAGLKAARDFMEPVKGESQFLGIFARGIGAD